MPVRAQYILEIGNSQRWINLKQSHRQYLGFLVTPSKNTACCTYTKCAVPIGLISQCRLCPGHGLIMATRKEMSLRHPFFHKPDERIDRAQAHSMCKAFDGPIRFAEPHFGQAAVSPSPCQVRINQQCLVDEGSTIIELAGNVGERMSGVTKYRRIVLAQLHGASTTRSRLRIR